MVASLWAARVGTKFVSEDGVLGDEPVSLSLYKLGSALLLVTGGGGDTQRIRTGIEQVVVERVD